MAYFTFVAFPKLDQDEIEDLLRYGKLFCVQHKEHECTHLEHQHCLIDASSLSNAFEKLDSLVDTKHTAPLYVKRLDEWLFGMYAAYHE